MPHEHEHEHEHEHGEYEHEHGHEHEHEHPLDSEPIERGAGRGRVLFLDCFSGIAGDMTIAALLDLGVPRQVVEGACAALPIQGYRLHVGHAHRSSVVATTFTVEVLERQPHRSYADIDHMLAGAALEADTVELARAIFSRLAHAEARVHRMPVAEVHFHEVGAVDAIVDIAGAAAALRYLDATVIASPLPMGRGFTQAQHGVLPLPAPATVGCLEGVPTYATDLDAELVTPTGAAIVATVATSFDRWPAMRPGRVGFGAGARELPDRPNMLRAVLGDSDRALAAEPTHTLVEANVDDIGGELVGHAIARLLEAGALDAWAVPVTMKKGRPGWVLSALAPRSGRGAVASTMLAETTTIGVRLSDLHRVERPRRVVEVATRFGAIPVKVCEGDALPRQAKPEIDACIAAAKAHGVTAREVVLAALLAFEAEPA